MKNPTIRSLIMHSTDPIAAAPPLISRPTATAHPIGQNPPPLLRLSATDGGGTFCNDAGRLSSIGAQVQHSGKAR
jgi:hypothetical protein